MKAPFLAKALDDSSPYHFCLDIQQGVTRTTPHWHTCPEIIYLYSGEAEFFFNDRWHTLVAGDMLVIPPRQVHCCVCRRADTRKAVVGFSEHLLRCCGTAENALIFPLYVADVHPLCVFRQAPALAPHFQRLAELAENAAPQSVLHCTAVLLQIYAVMYQRWHAAGIRPVNPKCRDIALQIERVVRAAPAAAPAAEEMAARMHISYSYMCRILRDNLHCSYTGLVHLAQIDEARRLLLTTDRSLVRIAAECGFCDTAYFIKLFRRYVGCTPKQLRVSKSAGL